MPYFVVQRMCRITGHSPLFFSLFSSFIGYLFNGNRGAFFAIFLAEKKESNFTPDRTPFCNPVSVFFPLVFPRYVDKADNVDKFDTMGKLIINRGRIFPGYFRFTLINCFYKLAIRYLFACAWFLIDTHARTCITHMVCKCYHVCLAR